MFSTKYNYTKYTFFWGGAFSQWYPSFFKVDGIQFNCAEQYMMYMKASVFKDEEAAKRIMASSDPSVHKFIGRQVQNFDFDVWCAVARPIVFRGNMAKYTQNNNLNKVLMDSCDTLLVEASPSDKVWGIGLPESKAKITTPDEWEGRNWLGEVLTDVRETLLLQSRG